MDDYGKPISVVGCVVPCRTQVKFLYCLFVLPLECSSRYYWSIEGKQLLYAEVNFDSGGCLIRCPTASKIEFQCNHSLHIRSSPKINLPKN